jgi:hypothetical protein
MRIKYTLAAVLLIAFVFTAANSFGQAVEDPASLPVYLAEGPITVDGILNESSWSALAPHLMFKIGGTPSGYSNTPTGHVIVKEPYTDISTTYVKFLRYGTILYVALQSDDKQVCKFDWEGDGMFMVLKNASNQNSELKLYVINSTTFGAETGGAAPIPAGGYGGVGVVNGTIYDSSDVDNGYAAEGFIDLSTMGYTTIPSSIQVFLNIFDPDNFSAGAAPWGPNGNFAKQWWGSEWGSEFRELQLLEVVVPVELTSFTAAYVGNSVELNWITATEINNKGFEIQRSSEGSDFIKITFIEGHGTTTEKQAYRFVDKNITPNTRYSYRLKQVDFDGQFNYSQVLDLGKSLPVKFELSQNYPNPFNPSTTVTFSLPVKSDVSLNVYNILGKNVMTVLNQNLEAGSHQVNLDASALTSGIYIYTISAMGENGDNFTSTKKMTVIK